MNVLYSIEYWPTYMCNHIVSNYLCQFQIDYQHEILIAYAKFPLLTVG